jgi:hypothetical protein
LEEFNIMGAAVKAAPADYGSGYRSRKYSAPCRSSFDRLHELFVDDSAISVQTPSTRLVEDCRIHPT